MAIEDAIFTVLEGNAGVSALVVARIYPGLAPEPPTYPFLAYHMISEKPAHAMGADVGIQERRVQIDCVAESATDARALALAVKAAISRFSGTVNYTAGSTVIEDIYYITGVDAFDMAARKFKRALDFNVVYDG